MTNINICLTVDWEGEHLEDVYDFIKMRGHFKCDVPLTHFICPNYFTRIKTKSNSKQLIKQALTKEDEVGLHIHCYRELIEHIGGINFRTEHNYHNPPNWFEENFIKRLFPMYSKKLSGRGVPLSVYDDNEIQKIIAASLNLLKEHLDIEEVMGFRAGGWIANDNVLNIISKLGFQYDSSAVPPSILSNGYCKENPGLKKDDYNDSNGIFTDHILNLWGYEEQKSKFLKNAQIRECNNKQAIQTSTQPFPFKNLKIIPNNCALTDFCSPSKRVIPIIENLLQQTDDTPNSSFLLVYGCHQEGDYFYKEQLIRFVNTIAKLNSEKIRFLKMNDILVDAY